MIEITVNIQAPALCGALNRLADALAGVRNPDIVTTTPAYVDTPQPAPLVAAPTVAPQLASAAPVASPTAPVPTTAPAYTLADLQRAAALLRDAGKLPALQALLVEFGAPSLLQLPDGQYGTFANRMRELGAKL